MLKSWRVYTVSPLAKLTNTGFTELTSYKRSRSIRLRQANSQNFTISGDLQTQICSILYTNTTINRNSKDRSEEITFICKPLGWQKTPAPSAMLIRPERWNSRLVNSIVGSSSPTRIHAMLPSDLVKIRHLRRQLPYAAFRMGQPSSQEKMLP